MNCKHEYAYSETAKTFVCKKCGYAVTREDKQKALAHGHLLLQVDEALGEEGKKALDTLIAVAVCVRPILGCDYCPRDKGTDNTCTFPPDEEIEQAVIFFRGG